MSKNPKFVQNLSKKNSKNVKIGSAGNLVKKNTGGVQTQEPPLLWGAIQWEVKGRKPRPSNKPSHRVMG